MSDTIQTNPVEAITAEQAREAANRWRAAELALQKIESDIKAKQAAVAAKFDEDIADQTLIQNDAKLLLMTYAEVNRDELMTGKAKSFELGGLKIGYKLKPASLLLKKAKDTWPALLARLKETTAGRKFVKKTEAVDKTALKKADEDFLKEVGVCIEQQEDFYVKL